QDTSSPIAAGHPGVGAYNYETIQTASIGHQDTVVPIPVSQASFTSSAQPTQVDLQWAPTTDDAAGIGLLQYKLYRSDITTGPIATLPTTATSFNDYSVRPSTTYTYTIYAIDQ